MLPGGCSSEAVRSNATGEPLNEASRTTERCHPHAHEPERVEDALALPGAQSNPPGMMAACGLRAAQASLDTALVAAFDGHAGSWDKPVGGWLETAIGVPAWFPASLFTCYTAPHPILRGPP